MLWDAGLGDARGVGWYIGKRQAARCTFVPGGLTLTKLGYRTLEELFEAFLNSVIRSLTAAATSLTDSAYGSIRDQALTYAEFPSEHWMRIRPNNVIERLNREIRRRTRVVGCFPDGNSALMLVCARLRHVAATHSGATRNT